MENPSDPHLLFSPPSLSISFSLSLLISFLLLLSQCEVSCACFRDYRTKDWFWHSNCTKQSSTMRHFLTPLHPFLSLHRHCLSYWRWDVAELKLQRYSIVIVGLKTFWLSSSSCHPTYQKSTPLLLHTYKKQSTNRFIKCLRLQDVSERERGVAKTLIRKGEGEMLRWFIWEVIQ